MGRTLPTRLAFLENALTKFVLLEPRSIANAGSRTSNREDIHEVCHMQSTHRRRAQAGSATAPCEILLEVPRGAAACKSEVHLAVGIRRLSQSTLFRRVKSWLPSAHHDGSSDWIATLVHQATSRTAGANYAN